LYENEDIDDVSVKDVLLELRKGRMGLIQTHDQLSFSYEAIVEGIERMENGVRFSFIF
jgi:tyrosine-protein phosphatase non-receptor type 1